MTANPAPLLEVSGVSRDFGDVKALDDVSLTIGDNEFFALLGPSGCGKTTLLRSIAGFEYPDRGSITLAGQDLLALPPERRPINLMFQSYALFPHLNVARNIAYGLKQDKLPKAEIESRVDEVLQTVGLTQLAKRRPAQLSGGQRQRVALARPPGGRGQRGGWAGARVRRPGLLLLDEPLSALDRKVRGDMQIELKRLQTEVGITFVVVTHDQEEAMTMADRIAVMSDGRVQQIAAPVDLYNRPANLFVADFIGTSNLIEGTSSAEGFESVYGRLPQTSASVAGPAVLVIRPENARIVSADAAAVRGEVAGVSYQGGRSLVAVVVEHLAKPYLVTVPGMAAQSAGDRVGVTWDEAVAVGRTEESP